MLIVGVSVPFPTRGRQTTACALSRVIRDAEKLFPDSCLETLKEDDPHAIRWTGVLQRSRSVPAAVVARRAGGQYGVAPRQLPRLKNGGCDGQISTESPTDLVGYEPSFLCLPANVVWSGTVARIRAP